MKWISVKDRLPEKHKTVFIRHFEQRGKKIDVYYAEARYDGKNFEFPYYGQSCSGDFDNVTHWMQPKEPKQ